MQAPQADLANKQFFIQLQQDKAVLDFSVEDEQNKLFTFYHIEVPPSFRGTGASVKLATV